MIIQIIIIHGCFSNADLPNTFVEQARTKNLYVKFLYNNTIKRCPFSNCFISVSRVKSFVTNLVWLSLCMKRASCCICPEFFRRYSSFPESARFAITHSLLNKYNIVTSSQPCHRAELNRVIFLKHSELTVRPTLQSHMTRELILKKLVRVGMFNTTVKNFHHSNGNGGHRAGQFISLYFCYAQVTFMTFFYFWLKLC